MVRVAFDTNILVSWLLHPGKPKRLIDLAVNGKIESISSADIIAEFDIAIIRDKFKLPTLARNSSNNTSGRWVILQPLKATFTSFLRIQRRYNHKSGIRW